MWPGVALATAAIVVPARAQLVEASVPRSVPGFTTATARPDAGGYYGPKLLRSEVRIPVAGGGYSIAATILRPDGPGPYGVVVLNHGVPASETERRSATDADFVVVAPVFARRGYAVLMPLRRGFGATGGEFAEDAGSCRNPDYVKGENAAADDVMAAYDYARSLPYVDGARMILAGQSAGAVVSMFVAGTRHPRGLVAVLGFAAGRGGNPNINPGVPCAVDPLADVFELLGSRVSVPVLWHYAENDEYFNPATSALWFKRFRDGGARAQYVLQPPFRPEGHRIFGELTGVRFWLPAVERFFAEYQVPFQRLDAADPGAQSLLAAKLLHIRSASCTGLYRVFLESSGRRAYAVSDDGHCGFAAGVNDAQEQALRECSARAAARCTLFAVDGAIVRNLEQLSNTMLNVGLSDGASQGK